MTRHSADQFLLTEHSVTRLVPPSEDLINFLSSRSPARPRDQCLDGFKVQSLAIEVLLVVFCSKFGNDCSNVALKSLLPVLELELKLNFKLN